MMKTILVMIALLTGILLQAYGQLALKADFTDSTQAESPIHHPLDIYNRISPINGFRSPVTANAKLCIVRPLGGKYRDGGANLSEDTYLWDKEKQVFYTDFTLLKKQIDGVLNKGFGIHQIVLDNPSWAFQRDSFGNLEGGSLKISTYGNAEPPKDFEAWAAYLKEVMSFLINTYGKEKVLKVQFGIGREIGTEGHWKGTKEEFFDFYQKSVTAIHEVLPEAKVGSHFLWGTSSKSWAVDFVKWSKANDVHYDVLGVSYYPFYNRVSRTNFPQVYNDDFGVIKDIPEWNDNAVFEIHEYALIETMSSAGNSYVSASAKYQNSFLVGLMKMFLENNIKNLFLWGTGQEYMPAYNEILKLKDNIYYRSSKSGEQNLLANYVDAIFSKDIDQDMYNVLAYNYNADPNSNSFENVTIEAIIDAPLGTSIKYRSVVYDKSTGTLPWSDWQLATTEGALENKSKIIFSKQLPVFSFLKYEFMITDEQPEVVDPEALIDDLIFYYPLETDGTDISKNKNHANIGNAVSFLPGKAGNGASFSFTEGSFLSSADSVYKYSYPAAYTIAFWLKVLDYSTRGDILQPTAGRTLLYSNGDLSFNTFHQKKAASFSVTSHEKDEWFHVAMAINQREGQTMHKFYVNGEQRGAIAEGYELETERPQAIGKLIFGAASETALSRNFTGMLDEVCMFNGILTETEIKFLMNSDNIKDKLIGPSSIRSVSAPSSIQLYPNPAKDKLIIRGANVLNAEIFNINGQLIKEVTVVDNQLNISSLKIGLYTIKMIDSKNNEYTSRFLKQ